MFNWLCLICQKCLKYQKLMLLFDRCVYFEHALCCEAIRDGSTDFSFAANNLKNFFRLVFNNDVGVQFLINLN